MSAGGDDKLDARKEEAASAGGVVYGDSLLRDNRFRAAGTNALTAFVDSLTREPWMREAACASYGQPDAWFPSVGGKPDEVTATALRTCRNRCPVVARCLAYVIEASVAADTPLVGIWGGTTDGQRRPVIRALRKANAA